MFSLFQFTGSTNTTKGNVAGVTGEMNLICSGHCIHAWQQLKPQTKESMSLYSLSHLGSTLQFATIKIKIFKEQNCQKCKTLELCC